MLSVMQGDIKYHLFSLWYDSTWDRTPVSRTIDEQCLYTVINLGRSGETHLALLSSGYRLFSLLKNLYNIVRANIIKTLAGNITKHVKSLDKAVCLSHSAYILKKGMNPTIHPPAEGK